MLIEVYKQTKDTDYGLIEIQEHCSHASAAGAFQVKAKGSVITGHTDKTTTVLFFGDTYTFKNAG